MEIAFLFHLYQPITQSEEVFRKVYESSYAPLLKKIAKNKNLTISLDIPLSLLEQMSRYGYNSWIDDVKELVRLEKVELVGSAAYHPILPKLPQPLMEHQAILNEYGLGYFVGEHHNLEGDDAIMLKNVTGFFPPELAVNEDLLSLMDKLGYRWIIVDESAIPFDLNYQHKHGVYRYKDYSARLVCRNRSFSNLLSFKRDLDMDDITDALSFFSANEKPFVVVLDGEFFGHHYDDGLILFDRILEYMRNADIDTISVSEFVEKADVTSLKKFEASSWGASDEDMEEGTPFPMWDDPDNEIQQIQWGMVDKVTGLYSRNVPIEDIETAAVLPIWDPEGLKKVKNPILRTKLGREILLQKALNSDQFWWASGKKLPVGDELYSPEMVRRSMKIWENLVEMYNDADLKASILEDMRLIDEKL